MATKPRTTVRRPLRLREDVRPVFDADGITWRLYKTGRFMITGLPGHLAETAKFPVETLAYIGPMFKTKDVEFVVADTPVRVIFTTKDVHNEHKPNGQFVFYRFENPDDKKDVSPWYFVTLGTFRHMVMQLGSYAPAAAITLKKLVPATDIEWVEPPPPTDEELAALAEKKKAKKAAAKKRVLKKEPAPRRRA